jgi:hypothetical protein
MKNIEIKGAERSQKFILEILRGSIKILGKSTVRLPQTYCFSFIKSLEEQVRNAPETTSLFMD